jgi:hypothetical protein
LSSPLEKLRALYLERSPDRNLWSDILDFARYGYLYVTPEVIVMAKTIPRGCSEKFARDTKFHFNPNACDTWYVWAYVGFLGHASRYVPYPLSYFAWHRRGGIKYYSYDHWLKRCDRMTPLATPFYLM